MNKTEYLLVCLMEECAEVAQRASKAIRFTLEECQPDLEPQRSNAQRIVDEIHDLEAVIELLYEKNILPKAPALSRHDAISAKRRKINKFMDYSIVRGALSESKVQEK